MSLAMLMYRKKDEADAIRISFVLFISPVLRREAEGAARIAKPG